MSGAGTVERWRPVEVVARESRPDGPGRREGPHRVTVVVPCFNYGKFVGDAVESALRQEDADVRVVVVDDGSTDGVSGRKCDRCAKGEDRVRVIHQANAGLPAARNRGAAGATSEFLVFLDADDWLEPGFVSRLAGACRGEGVSHAYSQQRMHLRTGTSVWRVPEWDAELLLVTNLHPVTALVRRECFEAVGGFDESMRGGYEDWDFWLRIAERGWRGERVEEPLFVYRRHSTETMIRSAVANHEMLYRGIVAKHRAMFDRHADGVLARMNLMLRREDMNWLDESGVPIRLLALEEQRERYEAMRAVRAHRAVHRVVDALPGPLGAGARAALAGIKRMLPAR